MSDGRSAKVAQGAAELTICVDDLDQIVEDLGQVKVSVAHSGDLLCVCLLHGGQLAASRLAAAVKLINRLLIALKSSPAA
jgi:uncharacterized protein involved in propanediol utilization